MPGWFRGRAREEVWRVHDEPHNSAATTGPLVAAMFNRHYLAYHLGLTRDQVSLLDRLDEPFAEILASPRSEVGRVTADALRLRRRAETLLGIPPRPRRRCYVCVLDPRGLLSLGVMKR